MCPRAGTGSRDYCESRKPFFWCTSNADLLLGTVSYLKDKTKVLRSLCCVWMSSTYGTSRSVFKKVDVNVASLERHFVQHWQHGGLRTCVAKATLAPRALGSCYDAGYNRRLFRQRVSTAWELFRTVLIVQFDSGGQWNTRAIGKEVEHNHTCRRGVVWNCGYTVYATCRTYRSFCSSPEQSIIKWNWMKCIRAVDPLATPLKVKNARSFT